MITILTAFRTALVADTTLIAQVPAIRILAGVRDDKPPAIPYINILDVSNVTQQKYAGAKHGSIIQMRKIVQISIFTADEAAAQTINGLVAAVLLKDNTILNAAGVRNVTLESNHSLADPSGLAHIPARYSCQYHYTR